MGQYKEVFNKDAYKRVVDLNEQIKKEKDEEQPDPQKLQDLYMKQLMASMSLNDTFLGPRNFRPY